MAVVPMTTANTTPTPTPIPAPTPSQVAQGAVPTPGNGHNSEAAYKAFLDASEEFGAKAGGGDISRFGWLMRVAEDGYNKVISTDKIIGTRQLGEGYDRYQGGRKKAHAMMPPRSGKTNNGKDRGVRISEAGNVLFVSQLPGINGLKAVTNVADVIKANLELKGETAALLVKGCKAQKLSPQALLGKDAILHSLQPTVADERSRADKLEAVAKRIEAIVKESGEWTPHLRTSHASLMQEIKDEGGTTRQKIAAVKAQAKANKVQRKGAKSSK